MKRGRDQKQRSVRVAIHYEEEAVNFRESRLFVFIDYADSLEEYVSKQKSKEII